MTRLEDVQDELDLALKCAPVDVDRVKRAYVSLSKLVEEFHDDADAARWRAHFNSIFSEK